ncbi:unnamed protein product [Didymodactylos carnosus]|uniref:PDZ domain-containing protein n=1 Tax=Didymodactylos carnosus TaxID=1234261 RepID=A0A8S2GWK4_9BILA|nr:unnamed protein product [Didymodactylos carnosus]CAF3561715.1 unnamed protein product [Didymodactylos carnosus]
MEDQSTVPIPIIHDFNEKPRSKTPTPYSNAPLADPLPLRSRTPLPNSSNRNIGSSTRTQSSTNPYDNNLSFLKHTGRNQNHNDNHNTQSSIEDTFAIAETFHSKPSITPMYNNEEYHPHTIDQNGHTFDRHTLWTRSARDIRPNDNNVLNNISSLSTTKLASNGGGSVRSKTPGPEFNSSIPYRNNINGHLKQRSKTPTTADFSSYNNTLPMQREQQQYEQRIHNSRSLQSVNSHQYYDLVVNLTLLRPEDGFGFRIIGGEEDRSQVAVGLIVPNSPAYIDGRLKPGDEIIKIDGHSCIRSSHEKVVELMQQAKQNQRVSLLVRRYQEHQQPIVNGNGTNFISARPLENDHHPLYPSNTVKRNVLTSLPSMNNDNNNNGGVRFITLYKTNDTQSFGFVIISSQNKAGATVDPLFRDHSMCDEQKVWIGKIIPNSPADYSRQLFVNDRILAVNNVDITHMLHTDVVNLIKESGRSITLKIAPYHDDRSFDVDGMRSTLPTENRLQKPYLSQSNSSNGVSNGHHQQSSIRPSSSSPMVIAPNSGINQLQYQVQQQYQTSINNNNNNNHLRNAFSHNPLNILERNPNRPVSRANGISKSTSSDDYFTIDLQRPHPSSSFGFSIRGGREFSIPLFILKLADDGPAARDGRMRPGDQIIEINNRSTYGMTHQDAISLIKDGGLYVRLLIRKTNAPPPSLDEVKTAMTSPILNSNDLTALSPLQSNGYGHQHHPPLPSGWHNIMPSVPSPLPKPERAIIGFFLYVASLFLFVVYVLWAYIPNQWLDYIGITYYPHKYWSIVFALLVIILILSIVLCNFCINNLSVPSLDDFRLIHDRYVRLPPSNLFQNDIDCIPPVFDMELKYVNHVLYSTS